MERGGLLQHKFCARQVKVKGKMDQPSNIGLSLLPPCSGGALLQKIEEKRRRGRGAAFLSQLGANEFSSHLPKRKKTSLTFEKAA